MPGRSRIFELADFRDAGAIWRAFRHSLRHILALALWAALLAVLMWFLFWLRRYPPQFGVWLWQKLPESLRFASPQHLAQYADSLLWLVMLGAVAKWLPIATTIAVSGFGKPALRSWRVLLRPLYWLWFCILVFVGVYIPYKLIWWISQVSELRKQAWSMGLRFFVAYAIVTTAWITLVWMVGVRTEKEEATTD